MSRSVKAEERRLRRVAKRLGLRLEKSRRRNPEEYDFGLYALFNAQTGILGHPGLTVMQRYIHVLDLEGVREFLEWVEAPPPIEVELPDGSMLSDQREAH